MHIDTPLTTAHHQYVPIGSYEAKTRLPELLRQISRGQEFEITLRGQPVARLCRIDKPIDSTATTAGELLSFMIMQLAAQAGADLDLRALIEDGRA